MNKIYLSLQIVLISLEICAVYSRQQQQRQLMKNTKIVKEIRCHLKQCTCNDNECSFFQVTDNG